MSLKEIYRNNSYNRKTKRITKVFLNKKAKKIVVIKIVIIITRTRTIINNIWILIQILIPRIIVCLFILMNKIQDKNENLKVLGLKNNNICIIITIIPIPVVQY